MSTEKKQQSKIEELKAKLANQLFDLGKITYTYEAQRRMSVDALNSTANALAEASKVLEGAVDAAAAPAATTPATETTTDVKTS